MKKVKLLDTGQRNKTIAVVLPTKKKGKGRAPLTEEQRQHKNERLRQRYWENPDEARRKNREGYRKYREDYTRRAREKYLTDPEYREKRKGYQKEHRKLDYVKEYRREWQRRYRANKQKGLVNNKRKIKSGS